jgi:DNA-binding transcriptional regulator YiaG
MPNLAQVLKGEIARLARRELRAQVDGTKKATAQHRREIADLKRRLGALARQLASMQRQLRATEAAAPREAPVRRTRFSPGALRSHRTRVGLSAAEYAKLVGVSAQTIYNWERGASAPGDEQRATLAQLRAAGKRALRARLAEAG